MKLYVMQHGDAHGKKIDPDRPLTEKGRVQVAQLADFLQQRDIEIERILHSGKLRAKQTAECMADAITRGAQIETVDFLNPNDKPAAIDWQSEARDKDTLLVSHLPFIAKLVSHLTINDSDRPYTAYQPGSIVCLECTDNTAWQLNWMIRMELLG